MANIFFNIIMACIALLAVLFTTSMIVVVVQATVRTMRPPKFVAVKFAPGAAKEFVDEEKRAAELKRRTLN